MKRKGITPVIAVVLLLLITVGAVASAWGLYQQITSNQQQVDRLNARQAASSTEISIQSVYNNDTDSSSNVDKVNVSLRNNGAEPVNLSSDVQLLVSPDDTEEYLPPNLVTSGYDIGNPENSSCFGGSGKVLTTSGADRTHECNTQIDFPEAGQTVDFRISYEDVDGYNWDFTCSPSSSDSIRCG
jgi:flagellin-like protein